MNKKLVVFLFFILFSSLPLFASKKIIWTWDEVDTKVSWYRYQVNKLDEFDRAWTYIANIPSKRYVIVDVDDNVSEYVLYIQSSYDGVSWSETARSVVDTYAFNNET